VPSLILLDLGVGMQDMASKARRRGSRLPSRLVRVDAGIDDGGEGGDAGEGDDVGESDDVG